MGNRFYRAVVDDSPRAIEEELEEALDAFLLAGRARGRGSVGTVRVPRDFEAPVPPARTVRRKK